MYTADVACSLKMQSVTTAVASSADASSSENKEKGAGYSQSVDIKVPVPPATIGGTVKTQIGFGKSSGTGNYNSQAQAGYQEQYKFRAKAVTYSTIINTEELGSCDMNEYFVTDVLELANFIKENKDSTGQIDNFLDKYGTHVPVKFELGCEVTKTYSFKSSIAQSQKSGSLAKTSSAGFEAFGFGAKTSTTTTDASSTAGSESEEQTESSTQITCGSGATSLEGFCSSVVMNDNQNAIPKMLSVDKLVPIWSIMEQVDPWIGSGTQEAPEITHELIKETADAAKQRFKDLTTVKDSDAMCNTAGNLMPPGEDGVCAFNGIAWDCSTCSCYDTNSDASPKSSCRRSVCKPALLAEKRKPSATARNVDVQDDYAYLTKDECHAKCLATVLGVPCTGFWYKAPVSTSTDYIAGGCLLYSTSFSKQDVAGWDSGDTGSYYQYKNGEYGCIAAFEPTKAIDNGFCVPNTGGPDSRPLFDTFDYTEPQCFKKCGDMKECVAANYDGGRCTLFKATQCTSYAFTDNGRMLKVWCQRALATYIPTGGDSTKCDSDGSWHSCDDSKCVEERKCDSNPDLGSCACPVDKTEVRNACKGSATLKKSEM